MQRVARCASGPGRGQRHLVAEIGGERMLLEDLRVAPARRAIELGDHDASVFEEYLERRGSRRIELDQPWPSPRSPIGMSASRTTSGVSPAYGRLAGGRRCRARCGPPGWPHPTRRCSAHRVSAGCRPPRRRCRRLVGGEDAVARPLPGPASAPPNSRSGRSLLRGWREGILEQRESCHSAGALGALVGHRAASVARRCSECGGAVAAGACVRSHRRHEQLQFTATGRQVLDRAAQVAHAERRARPV